MAKAPRSMAQGGKRLPERPPTARQRLAAQADDPEKLKAALVEAAAMARNIWITFISFGTYLVIAVGAVTHRHLFLEDPVRLPLLNVDLPLVGFFVVAPLLFLIFHLYLLLHLKLMADKVRLYSDKLVSLGLDGVVETGLRQQLPNFVFVHFLAGPRSGFKSLTEWLLIAIAWVTVVVGPVILLLMIQLQFLPYHLEWVTWVHRAVIAVDLGLLWWFWPDILRGTLVSGRAARLARSLTGTLSLLIILGSSTIATFQGEWVNDNPRVFRVQITVPAGYFPLEPGRTETTLTEYLFEGQVDEERGRPATPFGLSNRLVLPDQRFVDPEALEKIIARTEKAGLRPWEAERTRSFRGRDLRRAVLDRADLRRVDFLAAKLEGASLDRAQLQGTSLDAAQLQGASLVSAHLQGASLSASKLQGAVLNATQLQGALLDWAQLQGAMLVFAQLQGASLDAAQLQGASLWSARLQGASLDSAQLQGASLWLAQLQGADLRGALVWRAVMRDDEGLTLANLTEINDRAEMYESPFSSKTMALDDDGYVKIEWAALAGVPNGRARQRIREILAILKSNHPEWLQDRDSTVAAWWQELKDAQRRETDYPRKLARFLYALGCEGGRGPFGTSEAEVHIVRGLIRNRRIAATGPNAAEVEKAFLDVKSCPAVAAGLTAADKAELRRIVVANTQPKPQSGADAPPAGVSATPASPAPPSGAPASAPEVPTPPATAPPASVPAAPEPVQ